LKFNSFSEFFGAVSDGKFDMTALKETVVDMNENVISNPEVSFLASLSEVLGTFMPFLMMGVMLFIAFFGKKFLPLISFISFFFIGFAIGVCYTDPAISSVIPLPAWVSGLVIGILFAIFYRLAYITAFIGGICIFVYTLAYSLLNVGAVALIVGIAVAIVALIFRRFVEMFATSAIAGWAFAALIQNNIFDYSKVEFLSGMGWIVTLLIATAIALPGFIVQVKTRRRY
jgi:hypothetical protein